MTSVENAPSSLKASTHALAWETVSRVAAEAGWVKYMGQIRNPLLVGKKTFATAVGPRDAFLYLRVTRDEGFASVLEGSYESEGRNVVYFSRFVREGDTEEKIVARVVKYLAKVEAAIGDSYAVRLHRKFPQ